MTTKTPDHDLNHEVYLDPKDHKEHINHGMIEYTEKDLEMHNDAFHAHEESEVDKNDAKINDCQKEDHLTRTLVVETTDGVARLLMIPCGEITYLQESMRTKILFLDMEGDIRLEFLESMTLEGR